MFFEDRFHAGDLLADQLEKYKNKKDTLILAIQRGALQIGYVLSRRLHIPLDVVIIKEIGAIENPEFAIADLNRDGSIVFKDSRFEALQWVAYVSEQKEMLKKRLQEKFLQYHPDEKDPNLKNKTVIVVDDGVTTENTLISTLALIKRKKPVKIVVALPIGLPDTIKKISEYANEVVCLFQPSSLKSIEEFFRNFDHVEDDEALQLYKEANK